MWAAVLWGAVAASSLVIGAALGVMRSWSDWLIGCVLGFGAGALISSKATQSDGWIVDGNYSDRIRQITWTAADTVIWLDLPRPVVMWQLLHRTVRRTISGTELWNGNQERPLRDQLSRDPAKSILLWSWRTYTPTKHEYTQAMTNPTFSHIHFIRLKSRLQLKRFLHSIHPSGSHQ